MIIPELFSLASYFLISTSNPDLANIPGKTVVSSHAISLEKRYPNSFVNKVFKENILLNLAYMDGRVKNPTDINWSQLEKPFIYQFTLKSGETFAFHEDVKPEYKPNLAKTTNAHFNFQEGFKTDGYLFGDGVCHLASLIYWAAKDANLEAFAPANHDFMHIPEVPKEFGVSIYSSPGQTGANAMQNLYIANNFSEDVTFIFDYNGNNLKVSVEAAKAKQNIKI